MTWKTGIPTLNLKDSIYQEGNDSIVMELGKKVYFVEKFSIFSTDQYQLDNCAICLILPLDLRLCEEKLLNLIKEYIIKRFGYPLHRIIRSELIKFEIILTENKRDKILEGDLLKKQVLNLIHYLCSYFLNSRTDITDINEEKLQRAISFLESKGLKISHILGLNKNVDFSNIKLFEKTQKNSIEYKIEQTFKIKSIKIIDFDKEIEIIIKNISQRIFNEINIRITQIYDLFEKEILNISLESWLLDEELLFSFPSQLYNFQFLISIIDLRSNKIIFSSKISLENSIK